ncbi:zinc finger BED domain-containing protein 4-like [Macrobrachium nipponense]|uniref:zinc finger BED domain-containing protein 4-like n=1 Tax=Macrobrachium nipponense TaxID=159736 RepID=UPI0030C7FB94
MCLFSDELETVKQSISVLQPFELATKELSSEKITSLSKVIPMIKALRSYMSRDDPERRELYDTCPLGKELRAQLDRKFPTLESIYLQGAATLLDPRLKKLHFVDEGNLKSIQSRLQLSMRGSQQQTDARPAPQPANTSQDKQPSTNLWTDHDEIVRQSLQAAAPCVGLNVDLRRYLEEPIIPRDSDPICWWKDHSQLLPLMTDPVKKILCIPTTSVPSERVFSRAGELLSERRNHLSDENVSMLQSPPAPP